MKNINSEIRHSLVANEPKLNGTQKLGILHSNNMPAEIYTKFFLPLDRSISSIVYLSIITHLRAEIYN